MLCLPALAQDLERGKLLYDTHCNECHYARVHDRLRSDVKDLADLRDTVWARARETKKRSFTLDELNDVAEYLNASHYRFGLAPRKP
jgi:mono/diheme cytochrome c family protein